MWGTLTGHFNFYQKCGPKRGHEPEVRNHFPHTHTPPGPFDEVGDLVQQVEGVVGVSADLRHRPHHQEQDHTLLTLDLNIVSRGRCYNKTNIKVGHKNMFGLGSS